MYKLLEPLLDTKCFYGVVASRCYILKYVNLSKYFFFEERIWIGRLKFVNCIPLYHLWEKGNEGAKIS